MFVTLLLIATGTASGLLAYQRCRRYQPSTGSACITGTLIMSGTGAGVLVAVASISPITKIMLAHLMITCLPLASIDALIGKLPRRQVLAAYPSTAALVCLAAWWSGSATLALSAAVCAVGMWLLFLVLACFGGTGAGDVRLAPVLGAHLGQAGVLVALDGTALAFALGALTAALLAATTGIAADRRIPFGPAMVGGAIIALAA